MQWKVTLFKKTILNFELFETNYRRSWDDSTGSLLLPRSCSIDNREKKFYSLIAIKFFSNFLIGFICTIHRVRLSFGKYETKTFITQRQLVLL